MVLLNSITGTLSFLLYLFFIMKKRKQTYDLILPNVFLLIFNLWVLLSGPSIPGHMLLLFTMGLFFQEAAGSSRKLLRILTLSFYSLLYGFLLFFIKTFLPHPVLFQWLIALGPALLAIVYAVFYAFVSFRPDRYRPLLFSGLTFALLILQIPVILSAYYSFVNDGELLRIYLSFILFIIWDLAIIGYRIEQNEQNKEIDHQQLNTLFEQIDTLHNLLQHRDPQQDISSLYPRFFGILKERTGIEKAVVYLLNPEETELHLQAQHGLDQRTTELLKILPMNRSNIGRQAMEKRTTVWIDMKDYPENELKDLIVSQRIHILGSYPVFSRGKAIGVVTFGLQKGQSPNAVIDEILKVLTTQMGTALYNLKWYRQMSESEIRFKSIFNNLSEAILLYDHNLNIVLKNEALRQWVQGEKTDGILLSFVQQLENHFPSTDLLKCNLKLSTGTEIPLEIRIIPSKMNEKPLRIAILKDCRKEMDLKQKLADQKGIDPQTGILSRKLVEGIFRRERERAQHFQHPFCLMMIGLDHRILPEEWIVPLADWLKQPLKSYEYLCYNGDGSFTLLLPESDMESSLLRGKEILDLPPVLDGEKRYFSIGIDDFNGQGNPEEILFYWNNAFAAMEIARKTGGNRVVSWNKDMD